MNNLAEYNHDKALFFKLLCMRDNNKLLNSTFEDLIETAFKFILTFQSICARESKSTISSFVEVQNELYKEFQYYNDNKDVSEKNYKQIINIFEKYIYSASIQDSILKNHIRTSITYNKNKKVTKVILSYLEYLSDNNSIDYEKLYWLLKYGSDIHIDHILPLKPKKNENFKYYLSGDSIILTDGQDFISDSTINTIGKDDFYDQYLHIIGNLRLEWASDNIKKSNHLITLKEYSTSFNTCSEITARSSYLIKRILDSHLLLSTNNISNPRLFNNESDKIIDHYDNSLDYSQYKPISFELMDDNYIIDKYNYTQLLIKFVNVLFRFESDRFIDLAKENYSPMQSERIYISKDKNNVRYEYEIADNIFIETNLSSTYIIKFIYTLINEFETNYSIKIHLIENNK